MAQVIHLIAGSSGSLGSPQERKKDRISSVHLRFQWLAKLCPQMTPIKEKKRKERRLTAYSQSCAPWGARIQSVPNPTNVWGLYVFLMYVCVCVSVFVCVCVCVCVCSPHLISEGQVVHLPSCVYLPSRYPTSVSKNRPLLQPPLGLNPPNTLATKTKCHFLLSVCVCMCVCPSVLSGLAGLIQSEPPDHSTSVLPVSLSVPPL